MAMSILNACDYLCISIQNLYYLSTPANQPGTAVMYDAGRLKLYVLPLTARLDPCED